MSTTSCLRKEVQIGGRMNKGKQEVAVEERKIKRLNKMKG